MEVGGLGALEGGAGGLAGRGGDKMLGGLTPCSTQVA